VAFIMLLTPTTGHMSHMVTIHEQRQMKWPAICTNQTYQCSFVTRSQTGLQNSWRRSLWSRTSFQLRDVYSICRCCWNLRHINGKFTRWTFKLHLIKKVLFKLWSRSSCISGTC
jgi:hypothetical protein